MAGGLFGGGNGTISSPYIVEDGADLLAINNDLTANYKQTKNIDLSAWDNWPGVGDYNDLEFGGTYDGSEKEIMGMRIDYVHNYDTYGEYKHYRGLFNSCTNSSIKNVTLKNTVFYCDTAAWLNEIEAYLGAIVSTAVDCVFENCIVDGLKVDILQNLTTGQNYDNVYVGGFAFSAARCEISNCHVKNLDFDITLNSAYVEISGFSADMRSGIYDFCTVKKITVLINEVLSPSDCYIEFNGFSYATDITARKCSVENISYVNKSTASFFSQEVNGFSYLGSSSSQTKGYCDFYDCFVTGYIELLIDDNYTYVNGFGFPTKAKVSTHRLFNCYTAISLNGKNFTEAEVNPITRAARPFLSSCYTDFDLFGMTYDVWGNWYTETHKTTEQMKKRETFEGWDFENIWTIREGKSYPYFIPPRSKSKTKCERIAINKLLGGRRK